MAILAITAMFSGCGKEPEQPEPEVPKTMTKDPVFYYLSISFKGANGADMVEALDMKSGYKLEIVCPDINGSAKEGPSQFQKYDFYEKYPDYKEQLGEAYKGYCLFNQMMLYRDQGLQKTLTYRITSQSIFGDSAAHEIVTYWDYSDAPESGTLYPVCTKVTYNGSGWDVKKLQYQFVDEKGNKGNSYNEYHVVISIGK